jgi:NTP pyrophosphatase (non-canonical NTP hydrolase)
MELTQYIKDATRTESRIDAVNADPIFLGAVMGIIVASGTMLDYIKKNVYYGKEIDKEKVIQQFGEIVEGLGFIREVISEGFRNQQLDFDPRIFHSIVGITTEAVEMVEALTSPEFDNVNFLEELGDLNWYQAIGIDAVDGDFDKILETNIAKLRARYPEKFTNENAINRDLEIEREILESGC